MVLYIATFALCELLSFSTTLVAVIMILAGRVNLIGVYATSLSQQGGPHFTACLGQPSSPIEIRRSERPTPPDA